MNTYTLTEIELQELLKQQRVLCQKAWYNCDDEYNVGVAIVEAPLPPLPSGAKKEDIPDNESLEIWRNKAKYLEKKLAEAIKEINSHRIEYYKEKEDIQPVLRWVKAEERLPDERPGWSHSADVNILLRNVKDETHPLFVSTGAYRYLGVKKWCEYLYGDRLDKGDFEVVAWQPLPAAELSPSQDVPKSEELGNIRKQSLIELMEDDQRDGIYGVRDNASVEQAVTEILYKNSTDDSECMRIKFGTVPKVIEAICELLNKEQEDNRSVATMPNSTTSPDPQNAQKEPVIDNLRDKFFDELCKYDSIDGLMFRSDSYPIHVFEWFAPYLKSNSEPVIDWEGLKEVFFEAWVLRKPNGIDITKEVFNWLKSNLSNYIKAK